MPRRKCCEGLATGAFEPGAVADVDQNVAGALAGTDGESEGAGRPCCRRRAGGGAALVEPAALAALLAEGSHGYDVRRAILERTGGELDVDVGGLYRSLRRLEEDGAVVSRWGEDDAGPRRREYEVTAQGVETAEQWLDVLRRRQRIDELLVGLLEEGLAVARGEARPGPWV